MRKNKIKGHFFTPSIHLSIPSHPSAQFALSVLVSACVAASRLRRLLALAALLSVMKIGESRDASRLPYLPSVGRRRMGKSAEGRVGGWASRRSNAFRYTFRYAFRYAFRYVFRYALSHVFGYALRYAFRYAFRYALKFRRRLTLQVSYSRTSLTMINFYSVHSIRQ